MKYLPDIRATVRQVLKDEFVDDIDFEWKDDEIDIHIGLCLTEISERSPYKVREVLTTTANSRVLDISSIEDLIGIDKLEYPTGIYPRNYRNYNELDSETIEIDTFRMPSAGGSGTLTGTITFTRGSAAVTGSSTLFSTELKAGYHIKKSSGTRWYRIYSIESATALTLAEPCLETTGTDTSTQYNYETVYVYCDKVHILDEDTSTLNPLLEKLLVLGVSARAAIAKARSQINEVHHGGTRVPADMQAWGGNQLALYRIGLDRITVTQTYRTYPKD